MAETTATLPLNYKATGEIRFFEDKRVKRRLNVISLLILVLFFVGGNFLMPLFSLALDSAGNFAGSWLIWLKLGIIVLTFFMHGLLLEGIKGGIMKKLDHAEPILDFTHGAAYAGSPVYFSKKDYRLIALLPVIILAILFLLITLIIPQDWFWVGFAAQVINLAGGVKGYYTAFQVSRQVPEVLILDEGPRLIFHEPFEVPIHMKSKKRKGIKRK